MLYLSFVDTQNAPRTVSFDTAVVRFGRGASCEVRVAGTPGEVGNLHGEFIRDGEIYFVVSRDKQLPLYVNGKSVQQLRIQGGERIRLGSLQGPEVVVAKVTGAEESPFDEIEVTVQVNTLQLAQLQAESNKRKLEAEIAGKQTPLRKTPLPPKDDAPSAGGARKSSSGNASLPPALPSAPASASGSLKNLRAPASASGSLKSSAPPSGSGPSKNSPGSRRSAAGSPPAPPSASGALRGSSLRKTPAPPPVPTPAPPPSALPRRSLSAPAPKEALGAEAGPPERTMMRALKALRKPHKEVQHWLSRVQREVAQARSHTQGLSSGNTMVIMAQALVGIRQTAEGRAQKLRRRMMVLGALSATVVLALSAVVFTQQRRINQLAREKVALDQQIQSTLDAMSTETDETRLAVLENRLQTLEGSATEKLREVSRSSARRAQELTKPADPMEEEIRKILKSFNAETYAIPPIFKAELQKAVNDLGTGATSPALRQAYSRKLRYWPQIERALRAQQLPQELGYIAFTESRFDPQAQNPRSHASGMWQLMDETARNCGISVSEKLDERFDASRSSQAAACYLSKLMVEFGQESFMLALASYNRGENGVRRALHKLALEPGGYKKRDFWHLYRLKLLPEETREYVPRVLAAAVVLGNPRKYGLEGTR